MTRLESFTLSVIFLIGALIMGFGMGRAAERDAADARAMKAANAAYAELTRINKATVEAERALRKADRAALTTYRATMEKKTHETDRLIADLRDGTRRLRIAIRRDPAPGAVQAGPAAPGTGAEGYADVDPGAAEALVRLTDRGDTAIAKHAAVVDSYDRLAAACAAHNSQPPTTEAPDATP